MARSGNLQGLRPLKQGVGDTDDINILLMSDTDTEEDIADGIVIFDSDSDSLSIPGLVSDSDDSDIEFLIEFIDVPDGNMSDDDMDYVHEFSSDDDCDVSDMDFDINMELSSDDEGYHLD